MLFFDVDHETINGIFRLEPLLLDLAMLKALHFKHSHFVFKRVFILRRLNLQRQEVLLHSLENVVIGSLSERLFLYLLLSAFDRFIQHG